MTVGLVLPMTGAFASTGREIDAACRLYLQQKTGGQPIELLLRDDAAVADTTRRLVQELLVNDKLAGLAGLDEPTEGLAPVIVDELLAALVRIMRDEGLSAWWSISTLAGSSA